MERRCVDCLSGIDRADPRWKIRCLDCFKKIKPKVQSQIKKCLGCNSDLPKDNPYWKKVCFDCYCDLETCNRCGSLSYWSGDGFTCIECK